MIVTSSRTPFLPFLPFYALLLGLFAFIFAAKDTYTGRMRLRANYTGRGRYIDRVSNPVSYWIWLVVEYLIAAFLILYWAWVG
jgi:hypothetical protein